MARGLTPVARPERPQHTVEEKRQDIVRLQRRIEELEAYDPSQATKRFSDPAVTTIETAIGSTLVAIFGESTTDLRRYHAAATLDHGPISMAGPWNRSHRDEAAEARRHLSEGKVASLALLRQAVRAIEEEIEFAPAEAQMDDAEEAAAAMPKPRSNRVFVVHGHDEGARETLARFLERLGFVPIILHEQANQGRTIIEKIEAHGDVGFAVVLLTPDDYGGKAGGESKPRARQNVVLELGYFVGRLGRGHVCALLRGELEIPSDFVGVVYQPMDDGGGWKRALAQELEVAGYDIDWNTVMRPQLR